MKSTYLSQLIMDSMHSQNMDKHTLVQKMGYANLNKGLRRLDDLLGQEVPQKREQKEELIKKCAAALGLVLDDVLQAAVADEQEQMAMVEKWERSNFRPFVYVKTIETRPSSVTMFAITGGPMRHKAFYLPVNFELETQADQFSQLKELVLNHFRDSNGLAPFFGKISGYLYCPSYDESYDFSIEGDLMSENQGHFQTPIATVRL